MTPFFLRGVAGKLFCIYHEPLEGIADSGDLIFVPPFAEELNYSRHTVSKMARTLSRRGWGVLLLDLFGTGDSEGLFEECRWEIWREDIVTARTWLRGRGRDRVALWGLRLGGLLATEAVAAQPGLFSRLVLWQPVTSGRKFLTQFLRLRALAEMTDAGETPFSTVALRRRLSSGESLTVAGYTVAPEIAQAVDAIELTNVSPDPTTEVIWLEVIRGNVMQPSAGSREVIDGWQRRGIHVTSATVNDEPFWSMQALEPVWADGLIAQTIEML